MLYYYGGSKNAMLKYQIKLVGIKKKGLNKNHKKDVCFHQYRPCR